MHARTLTVTHVVALALGVSGGAAATAIASAHRDTQDVHMQILGLVAQTNGRIGTPQVSSYTTVNGQLIRITRDLETQAIQLAKLCRASSTTC